MDWEKIGLKVGLEIHWELDTKNKLFCECPTTLRNDEPDIIIERYLRPVVGELGEIDIAAQKEFIKKKKIIYQAYNQNNCLVELDEEPPHIPNQDAINAALTISLLLNTKPVDEIHVMRKIIIDGSNVSGFQRTMLIAKSGFVKTLFGNVRIKNISLEEDSARIIDNKPNVAIFRLDRLGVPEVEIGTEPDIHTPEQALEAAETIGNILKSTGMVKFGLGVVRQDVNVSIKGGARTEIKHVQRLGQIPDVVKREVERQLKLIEKGEKVENSVRVAKEDGTTDFLRPLSGAARMYVETDVFPIKIDKKLLAKIRKNLPESFDKKLTKYKERLKLPQQIAIELINSEYSQIFDKIVSQIKIDPIIVATVFTNVLKDLSRKNIPIENLNETHFVEIFKLIENKKLAKEGIPILLEEISRHPEKSVEAIISELKLTPLSKSELIELIKGKIRENKEKLKDQATAYKFIMGITMADVRGRIDGKIVNEAVKQEIENYFRKNN